MEISVAPEKPSFLSKLWDKIKSPEPNENLGAEKLLDLARNFKQKANDSASWIPLSFYTSTLCGGAAVLTGNVYALAASVTMLGAGLTESALWGVRDDLADRFQKVAVNLKAKSQ